MDEITPSVKRLLTEKTLPRSQLSASAFKFMRPLFDGGVLSCERSGRGETVRVIYEDAFLQWVRRNFPAYEKAWIALEGAHRAQAIALRRDSKTGGFGVDRGMLHFRALSAGNSRIWLDDQELVVTQTSKTQDLVACIIGEDSHLHIEGRVALIENLECFLKADAFLSDVSIVLYSAGRISDRLIACLRNSRITMPPLLHAPDYDPVGLSDYLRLRAALGAAVRLWLPVDLELRFATFGNRELISKKPRNRALLEKLGAVKWPCRASAEVFRLIKETGSGLEQESLLIAPGRPA